MIKYITFFLLLVSVWVFAGDGDMPYVVSFDGRWEPAEEPFLINEGGFQDIQNMRRNGRGYSGVKGHTQINTSAWDATLKYAENGFHFKKDQPPESHFMVSAKDSSGTTPTIFVNTTVIPLAGSFSGTTLLDANPSAGLGRFSDAPQGTMVYANGAETKVYGGNEAKMLGFEVYDPLETFRYDYFDQVNNSLTTVGNIATISSATSEITSDVKLILHGNGTHGSTTIIDDSSSGHTVTANDGAIISTSTKKFGTASIFFPAGGYLSVPDHADWNFSSNAFTLDLWVYRSSSTQDYLISQASGATWQLFVDASDRVNFESYVTGTVTADIDMRTTQAITINTWHHVALTREGSDWNIWVDGISRDYLSAATAMVDIAGELRIGSVSGVTPPTFNGFLDEVRVNNGKALYDKNFETPTSEYTTNTKGYMLVGCPVPATGFKYYVQTANSNTSSVTVYRWVSSAWSEVSGVLDSTSSGGISFAQTGLISWTAATTDEKKLNSLLDLYWYKVEISNCNSSTQISKVAYTFPFSNLTNIWNGVESNIVSGYKWRDNKYTDYSLELQTNSTTGVAVLNNLTANQWFVLGFASKQQAFDIKIQSDKDNSSETFLTVSYWSGTTWVSVSNLKDGTSTQAKSLSSSGLISFDEIPAGSEFRTEIEANIPLYYYRLSWSAQLDSSVELYFIQGIPAQEDLGNYSFSETFQNRLFLFSEDSLDKNKATYSAFNTYYTFNGDDSGSLHFGNDEAVTASVIFYNLYDTVGFEQMIVTKQNETYTVFGDNPTNWTVVKMSDHIGCIAPLSIALCEIVGVSGDNKKNVAIWVSSSGVFMCDGANIIDISHDIRNYFDSNDSTFIPVGRQDDSVGWYDPNIKSYRLLISSGSGQVNHNLELEYSLKYGEWTKIYREKVSGANPLQAGFNVRATNGATYSYGATDEGIIYRLENTNKWNTTNMNQFIQTKNLLLDSISPLLTHTVIEDVRTFFKDKNSTSASMSIAHYADDVLTTENEETNNNDEIDDINLNSGPWDYQSCILGPALFHSFKISSTAPNVSDGLEIYGMSLYYERYDRMFE